MLLNKRERVKKGRDSYEAGKVLGNPVSFVKVLVQVDKGNIK
jgi:hypothetical protein